MRDNNAKLYSFCLTPLISLCVLLSACTDNAQLSTKQVQASRAKAKLSNPKSLLKLHNRARENGVRCGNARATSAPRLKWNEELELAAKSHAHYLAQTKQLSHRGKHGSSITDRIESEGYSWTKAAENVAHGYQDVESLMRGWLTSIPHCKNIMNKQVSEMGAAERDGYWVAVFAHH